MSKSKKELIRLSKERDKFKNEIIKVVNKIKEDSEFKVCLLEVYLEDVKCWNKEIFNTQVEIELFDEIIDHETV